MRRSATPSLREADMRPERTMNVFDKFFTVLQIWSRKKRVKISETRLLIGEMENERVMSDEAVIM